MPYAELAACFPMCKSPYVIIGLTEHGNSADFKCTYLYFKPEIVICIMIKPYLQNCRTAMWTFVSPYMIPNNI